MTTSMPCEISEHYLAAINCLSPLDSCSISAPMLKMFKVFAALFLGLFFLTILCGQKNKIWTYKILACREKNNIYVILEIHYNLRLGHTSKGIHCQKHPLCCRSIQLATFCTASSQKKMHSKFWFKQTPLLLTNTLFFTDMHVFLQ